MIPDRRRSTRAFVLVAIMLSIGGCQSLPGSGVSVADLDQVIPGEIVRSRHAHVIEAIGSLGEVLGEGSVRIDDVPFDTALEVALSPPATGSGDTAADVLRRLAEKKLIAAGPYRLVRADLPGERLEYRSERTGAHLSVYIRAPDGREGDEGRTFIVTDLFGQTSLAELADKPPHAGTDGHANGPSSFDVATALSGRDFSASDDAGRLAYFDALPRVEREREDLLGLRIMLMMRLGRDDQANPLVQQGIIRYPGSPLYLTLAGVLFERANPGGANVPTSLSETMRSRFDKREIRDSRQAVERFLNRATVI